MQRLYVVYHYGYCDIILYRNLLKGSEIVQKWEMITRLTPNQQAFAIVSYRYGEGKTVSLKGMMLGITIISQQRLNAQEQLASTR